MTSNSLTSKIVKRAALLAVLTVANVTLPAVAQECDLCRMMNHHGHEDHGMFDNGFAVAAGFELINRALIAPRMVARGETLDPDTGIRIRVVRADDGSGTIQRNDGLVEAIRPMKPTKPRKPTRPKPYEVRHLPDGGTVTFLVDANGTRTARMEGPDGRPLQIDGEIGDRGGNWVRFR